MNRYSRIFHHITTEDVKRKRRENIKVQKIKEELERERLEAIVEPVQHVDWRDDLKELVGFEWVPTKTGAPTNSASVTFTGQYHGTDTGNTFTANGLGGSDVLPTSITVDVVGERWSVDPPTYSQFPVAGLPMPVSAAMWRQKNEQKAKDINKRLDASEQFAKKVNADALMQARVDEYHDKVDAIQLYNNTVRENNINKIKDYVKSLKLKNIDYDKLAKKGAIRIKGGAVGIEDDGKGNIGIGVFKGPDIYVKGRMIYYLGQDYSSEIKKFNTEEGVAPVPEMPDDLQKWVDAKYQKTVDLYNMSDDDILDRLATKYNVGVSKNMFDYYMDEFIDNPHDRNLNMNRIFKPHLNRIKGYMPEIEKLVKLGQITGDSPEQIQRDINNYWNSSISPQMPADLRNSLGNGSRPDVKKFIKTGNWQINKSFVYTEPDDFQGREFGPKWFQALSNKLPKLYARLKSIQGGKWGSLIPFTNKPMRYNITVPGSPVPIVKPQSKETDTRKALSLDEPLIIDKKKKKKKKVTESKVFDRIKKDFSYKGKPSPDGFPDAPPPKLKNGWHPGYGKKDNMYNRLDPISAKSMPKTGDPTIDKKVEKAKKKNKA